MLMRDCLRGSVLHGSSRMSGCSTRRNAAKLLNCAKRMRRKKEYVVSDETADRYVSLVVLPGEDYMDSYRCTERQYHADMRQVAADTAVRVLCHLIECVPTQEDLTLDKKVGTAMIFYERLKFWCTLLNGTEKL